MVIFLKKNKQASKIVELIKLHNKKYLEQESKDDFSPEIDEKEVVITTSEDENKGIEDITTTKGDEIVEALAITDKEIDTNEANDDIETDAISNENIEVNSDPQKKYHALQNDYENVVKENERYLKHIETIEQLPPPIKEYDGEILAAILTPINTFDQIINAYRENDGNELLLEQLEKINDLTIQQLQQFGLEEMQVYGKEIDGTYMESFGPDPAGDNIEKVHDALNEAGLSSDDIDEVLMVGGSTRVPAVQDAVESIFKDKIRTDVNPDEVVAQGAAVQAALKSGKIDASKGLMAIDVCPYTLGIEITERQHDGSVIDGVFDPIIEKNTPIPTKNTKVYSTNSDYQTDVHLKIYQGEERFAVDNVLVSDDIVVHNIPSAPAGNEQIQVTFHYDINGLINVEALIVSTGEIVAEVIESQAGVMSEQDKSAAIQRMEEEESTSDAYDRAKKAIHRAEKLHASCSAEDQAKLDQQIKFLQDALEAEDVRAIERNEQNY